MGIYDSLRVDRDKEKEGVKLNYGDFWLIVTRAGGSNHKYKQTLTRKTRPFQSAINNGTLPHKVEQQMLAEVAAEAVVIGWGSGKFGDGQVPDLEDEEQPMEFNQDNVVKFLTTLDILQEVLQYASARESFQDLDGDVKK